MLSVLFFISLLNFWFSTQFLCIFPLFWLSREQRADAVGAFFNIFANFLVFNSVFEYFFTFLVEQRAESGFRLCFFFFRIFLVFKSVFVYFSTFLYIFCMFFALSDKQITENTYNSFRQTNN